MRRQLSIWFTRCRTARTRADAALSKSTLWCLPGGPSAEVQSHECLLLCRPPSDGGQGWQGRLGALTSAPSSAPPGEISALPHAPPSASGLARASPASRPPGPPPDLFCPGLTQRLGWHAREDRVPAPRAARRACAASCACTRCRARCAYEESAKNSCAKNMGKSSR